LNKWEDLGPPRRSFPGREKREDPIPLPLGLGLGPAIALEYFAVEALIFSLCLARSAPGDLSLSSLSHTREDL